MSTTDKTNTQPTKIYRDTEVAGLFSTPPSSRVVVDSKKYGKIEFEVKPMDNEIYAEMGNAMDGKDIDINNMKTMDGLKAFGSIYYPAMKVVFPKCCISPKVINGESTDKSVIQVSKMALDVAIPLLEEIMKISGLASKDDEDRKN